jgi:hypothetical protein
MFDRFLKDPSAASCGCDDACCGAPGTDRENSASGSAAEVSARTPENYGWIVGQTATPVGEIPIVSTRLTSADRFGSWKARWGLGRMRYAIPPGLYAVGRPDPWSPVFVTANYKMSFDRLRAELSGRDGWILVLDTRGINVWCAAGKGTFGTDELVRRIEDTSLARVLSHRTLILPQLGAPGVAAHEVAKRARFRVVYGPVRASDLPAFLDAGMTAAPGMRTVRFGFRDRLVLTPNEITGVAKHWIFLAVIALWLLGRLVLGTTVVDAPAIVVAVLIGTLAVPALLPWIPGRAFALKGWLLGLLWAAVVCALHRLPTSTAASWLAALSYILILPAVSAFTAMNFTGTSTITSLSGVVKEMKTAVPLMIVSAILGLAALVTASLVRI